MKAPLIFVFACSISISAAAYGQWAKVADKALGAIEADCCGFGCITFRDGIAWAGHDAILMSRDSGRTWQRRSGSLGATITQIDFFDSLNGIASTRGGIFLTHDQGKTWTSVFTHQDGFAATFAGSADNIVATCDGAGFLYSIDGAKTWNSVDPGVGHQLTVLGIKNGTAFAHAGSDATARGFVFKTTDRGNSWSSIGPDIDYDGWSLAIDSCSTENVYFMNEEGHILWDRKCQIFQFNTTTSHWDTIFVRAGHFLTGALSFSLHALYASTLDSGVFRTLDHGNTWKSIGGPSVNNDTKLLCAITDNIILQADNEGSIWRTTNSGGDSVTIAGMGPAASIRFSSSRLINDSLGVTLRLPIYLHHSGFVSDIQMVMSFPTGALTYLGSVSVNGSSLDVPGSQWSGRSKLHFTAADIDAITDSLAGFSLFRWSPNEYECSPIVFDSISALLQGSDCKASTQTIDERFVGWIGTYAGCGSDAMGTGEPAAADASFTVVPNPSEDHARITASSYSGDVTLFLYDLGGRLVRRQAGFIAPLSPIELQLGDLATGVYHLSITGSFGSMFETSFVHYR